MTDRPGHALAEIGVRLLDDAYIARFDAESDCSGRSAPGSTEPLITARKRTSPTAPRSIERKRPPATCSGARS
jgi:hypothetical protein